MFPLTASAYQEAPELAERVARGELPPVKERLPEDPAVVKPVERIGEYGGSWRRMTLGNRDIQLDCRMGYDPLVRWDRSGTKVEPGLAKSWEIRDEGRTYIFHLRKGLKWSDGHPLTSEDFVFHCDDYLGNKDINPIFPAWLKVGGERARISAPDPYTIIYTFAEPYGIFLEVVAFRGNWMITPKHYMKQFHPKYTDMATLEAMTEEAGLNMWRDLFSRKVNVNENPEIPTCKPWVLVEPPPARRVIAKRNPYYWKVDTAGNQLPYIDRVVYTDVQNNEIVTLRAMAGEVDFQARRIDASNYPLFMENREKGDYRVLRDENPSTVCLYLNQCSKDMEIRRFIRDRQFRVALSVAVNREEIIDVLFTGMAVPARGVVSPYDPFYQPYFDELYMEYDPDLANRLLDDLGLKRGRNGIRRLPSGRPFRQILNVYPAETGTSSDLWQVVADYWRDVGLDFIIKIDAVYLSVLQVRAGNSDFWAYNETGMHWIVDPLWYVPWQSTSYFAPAYGRYIASGGKDKLGRKPPPEFMHLVDSYRELTSIVVDEAHPENEARRLAVGTSILSQWAVESYVIGICRPDLITIVSNRFHNVPEHIIHDWRVLTPGYIGIEQFFIDDAN